MLHWLLCPVVNGQDKLHFKSVLVDTHNDLLTSQTLAGKDVSHKLKEGHSDLPRLKEGGVDVQFFSVWTGETPRNKEGYFKDALQQIDSLELITLRNNNRMALAYNYKQLKKLLRTGKLVGLIGVEGGHMIESDIEKLEILIQRGMMYLTLTHNNSTSWATSARDEVLHPDSLSFKGLTEFGMRIVKRLNDAGVLIDLSHAGEQTFYDVLQVSTKPVILSHSSVTAFSPHWRNVNDEQIKAVASNGGVICINFYAAFLDSAFNEKYENLQANKGLKDSVTKQFSEASDKEQAWDHYVSSRLNALRPSYTMIADHIDHVVKLVGDDYVGIGADLDGIDILPNGFKDATDYPLISAELKRRGYSDNSIKKILGKNVIRVIRANAQKK